MAFRITPFTQTLSAAGAGIPVAYVPVERNQPAPSILVKLSAGAVLTYNIEVTGDDPTATGYNPATGNWFPFPGLEALTASQVGSLGALVSQVRLNITAYTSGKVTWQFVQAVP